MIPSVGQSNDRPGAAPRSAADVRRWGEYLPLADLAIYGGVSVRWLRERLTDPAHPLPHYRLGDGGKILVRRSEFDSWIATYRTIGRPSLARAIRELGLDPDPELIPGTVAYAGYGSLFEEPGFQTVAAPIPPTGRYVTVNRGLFFKVSYLHRF